MRGRIPGSKGAQRGIPHHAMDTTELVLLLSEVPGVGDKTMEAVLRRCATLRHAPDDFLRLSPAQLTADYGLRREIAARLNAAARTQREAATATAKRLRRAGVSVLTLLDAIYPPRLLQNMDDPPSVLYAYGRLDLLEGPLFAVANSNDAPEEALAAGDAAASAALAYGWSPVTGHNRPAYQRPALVARRSGARICYLLDRGLLEAFGDDLTRELFPAARIWSPAYDPASDLTLSPFGLRDHGIAHHNRRRDALIFALADVVFVGSVRSGGQMERGCLDARARGKPVFLVGPESKAESRLLEAGAQRVEAGDAARLAEILRRPGEAGIAG